MNSEQALYIVIRVHSHEYISSNVYLTRAKNETEAIISCMEFEDLGIDDEAEYNAELERLRSLPLEQLERAERDTLWNVWSARRFVLPSINENNPIKIIAALDTD